jgi:predicted transposase YdaD
VGRDYLEPDLPEDASPDRLKNDITYWRGVARARAVYIDHTRAAIRESLGLIGDRPEETDQTAQPELLRQARAWRQVAQELALEIETLQAKLGLPDY